MNQAEENRYIAAYAHIIGVQESVVTEYAERKGLAALVDNAYQLLETPEQRAKHKAFLDLYRMSSSLTRENPILSSPTTAAGYMHTVIDQVHDKESMVVAFLNTKNRVIDYEQASVGTINSSIIHPREIFRNAILNKAVSVLICHNHPSGELTPSDEDLAATKALKEAGEMLGIPVVDHIIITGLNQDAVYSFRAHGILEQNTHYDAGLSLAEKKVDVKDKDKALDEITAKLEEGIKEIFSSGKYADYLKVMSRFHHYSLNNTLLIAMQNPEASLVASYHAWQKRFERQVLKGEKAIRIIAPVEEKRLVEKEKIDPQTKKPVLDSQDNPVMEEQEVTVKHFRVVPVFDVSQTEGKELPTLVKELQGNVPDYDLLFEAMKSVSPVPIEFKAMKADKDGYFHLKDKKIALRQGMSEIQTVATAIHEISHAKLHDRDPQQRGAKGTENEKDQRTQEVEAESIAYAVCQYYGIETADNSFGYLAGWSSDKDLSELKVSLQTIRDTASELISSIDDKIQNLKQELEVEEPKTRKAAVKAVKGKVAALAEALQPYAFEALPESALQFEDHQLNQTESLRPWLETVAQEDRSPYTTRANKLLQQIDQIQEPSAIYLLENGETLTLLREDDQVHYMLTDSLQKPVSEGFLGEPDLMLDAAKDLSLSEVGRDGITATLLTAEAIEHLDVLRVSEPLVSFSHSEHAEIPDGLHMPLSQANRLMERLDQRQAIDRQKSDYSGPLTYSTDFRVEYIKEGLPAAYAGKQKIGAGDGSLSHHMQVTVQEGLSDRSWRNYLKEMGETQLQADPNALGDVRDEIIPYFNQHTVLAFLKERTEGYQAGLPTVAEEKREALSTYYADVVAYVQESRQQMNLNSDPQIPEFPQLASYIKKIGFERDIDHDGSPERVDIDDQDARVQLIHHKEMLDGKGSVHDRLRKHSREKEVKNIDIRSHKELDV
jgi:DNA repair protein RadC/HPt (histidine-containing phosphotransfer) domain-containing protein